MLWCWLSITHIGVLVLLLWCTCNFTCSLWSWRKTEVSFFWQISMCWKAGGKMGKLHISNFPQCDHKGIFFYLFNHWTHIRNVTALLSLSSQNGLKVRSTSLTFDLDPKMMKNVSTAGGSTGGVCPPVGIQLEGLILPPVLIIDVILGLLGNLVALWIFCFKMKSWNPNNLFLFNLVIADFLALVSLPLRIDALLRRHWIFGDVVCRLNLFLMFSNRSASIALMTVVAIYRYFKVRS